jgi:hypothetical protein
MRFNLPDINPIQHPLQFFRGDFDDFFVEGLWPWKEIFLKPLKPESKTSSIPVQNFETFSTGAAKNDKAESNGLSFISS